MRKLVLLLLCLGAVACGPHQPAGVVTATPNLPPLPPNLRADEAVLIHAMPQPDEFAPATVKQDNLPIFIRLAQSSQDELLRLASLRAMRDLYPASATDAYTRAVARNLRSTSPRLVQAAMEASSPCLGREASPEVRQELLRLVRSPDEKVRLAALDTLWQAEPFPSPVYLQALKDSDPVTRAVAVVHLVQQKVRDHVFFEPARRLLDDSNPGVRGKAIDLALLTAGPQERTRLSAPLEALLADPHPYVRTQAALGLAWLGRWASLPQLMGLLSDRSAGSYVLEYTNLLGQTTRLDFRNSLATRVDEAALQAISRLSQGEFRYQPAGDEQQLLREIERARRWYRQEQRLD